MPPLVRGALAGAAGTLAMDLVWYRRHRRTGGTDSFADWELSTSAAGWDDVGAPAQVGKRLAEDVLGVDLPPEAAAATNTLTHWATGMQWGMLFALVARRPRRRTLPKGVALGLLACGTSYAVLPRLGIYEPITEYDAKTLLDDFGAHAVFGAVTAVAFATLAGRST